ncbi:MAG TPA: FMN-binding negative transcriptional regulator [Burkholderiaceae bacterium]|jgi:transcriptional regulator|nr:FMN-binding negative transcriptional regulator [Burkholderiaceae bacterium]
MIYLPQHFTVTERAPLRAVIDAHPFATLVSVADGEPCFTHLPLVAHDSGAAITLLGHVARANPHSQALTDGAAVTAIFHGPHGYVSPRLYTTREAVPTWNYVVVHAHGRLARVDDSAGKEAILKALIDAHDPAYRAQWDELAEEFRERMKGAIVGLRIAVERLEGKFKLSQNRPPQDRTNVAAAMEAGGEDARALAAWMRRLGIA